VYIGKSGLPTFPRARRHRGVHDAYNIHALIENSLLIIVNDCEMSLELEDVYVEVQRGRDVVLLACLGVTLSEVLWSAAEFSLASMTSTTGSARHRCAFQYGLLLAMRIPQGLRVQARNDYAQERRCADATPAVARRTLRHQVIAISCVFSRISHLLRISFFSGIPQLHHGGG